MPEPTAPTTTLPAAPSTPPATPVAPVPTPPPAAPATEKQPPWGKPENFDADKAWGLIQRLKAERGDPDALRAVKDSTDQRLTSELNALKAAQESQRTALAVALGVTPETVSDEAKLAARVEALQGQILTSEKRALAVEFKVPVEMLTAPDADGLRTQATSLAEFAQAAHYAAITAQPAPPAPAFQPNPGQGQGGGPLTPEAQAAAEYEKYYPSTPSK